MNKSSKYIMPFSIIIVLSTIALIIFLYLYQETDLLGDRDDIIIQTDEGEIIIEDIETPVSAPVSFTE